MATDPPRPAALVTVGLSLVVLGGDVLTGLGFALGCAVGENLDATWREFCESSFPLLPWAGALAVTAGAVLAHWRRSYKPWIVGASLGTASALALWVLVGDPAGNFGGIRT